MNSNICLSASFVAQNCPSTLFTLIGDVPSFCLSNFCGHCRHPQSPPALHCNHGCFDCCCCYYYHRRRHCRTTTSFTCTLCRCGGVGRRRGESDVWQRTRTNEGGITPQRSRSNVPVCQKMTPTRTLAPLLLSCNVDVAILIACRALV